MFKKKSSRVILITLIAIVLWAILFGASLVLDAKVNPKFHTLVTISEILGLVILAVVLFEIYIGIKISSLFKVRKIVAYVNLGLLTFFIILFTTLTILSRVSGLFIMIGNMTWDYIAFFNLGIISILIAALFITTDMVMKSFRFFASTSSISCFAVMLIMGAIFIYLGVDNKVESVITAKAPDNSVTYNLAYYPSTGEFCVYKYHNKLFSEYIREFTITYADKEYFDGTWCQVSFNEETRYMIVEYYDRSALRVQKINVKY